MWNHRIYKYVKGLDGSPIEHISFKNFLWGIRNLCRSEDKELDSYIF